MDIHKDARTTPHSRAEIARRVILGGEPPGAIAAAFGVCLKTVGKWVTRFKAGGFEALADRFSRPHHLHKPTAQAVRKNVIDLCRMRRPGCEIARETGVSASTVSRILRTARLSRARDLDPPAPARRYEHAAPGHLIHLDIKKLGRFERIGHRITDDRTGQSTPRSKGKKGYGWEYVHVCIDDASRISFTQIHPDKKVPGAVTHLRASVAYYQSLGVTVRRVVTDNGACYRSHVFRDACRELGRKHIRTRPYTPRTNGKAERFIQTALREWAYARAYVTSDQPAAELPAWTHRYSWHQPHGGSKVRTPIKPPRPLRGQPVESPHLASRDPCTARIGVKPKDCVTNWTAVVGQMDTVMPRPKEELRTYHAEFMTRCARKVGCEPTDGRLNNGARTFGQKSPTAPGARGVQGLNEVVGRLGFNIDHTDPGFGG